MEKKKLLLVAVSVGVFLVIMISAAILVFTPKSRTGTSFSSSRPIAAGTTGTLPPEEVRVQPVPPPVNNNNSVNNAAQESNVYISGDRPGNGDSAAARSEGTAAPVTITVPKPSTAAVPNTPSAASKAPASPTRAAAPAASKPAAPKPAASVVASKPAAASAALSASKKSDYWVQTGAFSTQVRAEGVKETLAGKGITSIIENRQVDGKTWYRVRVGPYTTETEANYWLTLVKSIDGFAESQVRQTLR